MGTKRRRRTRQRRGLPEWAHLWEAGLPPPDRPPTPEEREDALLAQYGLSSIMDLEPSYGPRQPHHRAWWDWTK